MNAIAALPGLGPVPSGLCIEQVALTENTATLVVQRTTATAPCPLCGQPSQRVHSRYQRKLADLPMQGKTVLIHFRARRFFCNAPGCPRQIFAERIPELARVHARTTLRLCQAHAQIGLALGGEPGSRLAKQLAMPTSSDTLLRRAKQYPIPPTTFPRIVGIDEWAWRKGQRYGTILIDLERHRVVDLLPDQESQTVQAWLKEQPQIEIISRDRSGVFALAARSAAPQAKQVADRWHLLKNLREAIERLFQRCRSSIQEVLAKLPPPIASETQASVNAATASDAQGGGEPSYRSRRRQGQQLRRSQRVERFEQVRQMHQEAQSVRHIAHVLGMSRETVRRYLREEQCPDWQPGRARPVRLHGFRELLDRRLRDGCRNAAQLHRELTSQGHTISYHAVRRFVRRRLLSLGQPRSADRVPEVVPRLPSARQLAFAWVRRPEDRDAEENAQLEAVCGVGEELRAGLALADEFAAMTRKILSQPLAAWLEKAEQSVCPEMQGFARSLRQDEAAVAAGLSERWSNGPVEGHVNRLKAIKRQMYGRAGFALLRARVLHAAA
jgi:transposase